MHDRDPRVSLVTERDDLPEPDRHHFDRIAESRGSVRGPFAVLLHSPELGGRVGRLGAYLRFESDLPGTARELAVLATARAFDCAYEWEAHEPLAREAGVSEEAIAVVADARRPDPLAEDEAIVVRYVRALLSDHEVPDALFGAARDRFGRRNVVDLTVTVGYYGLLACVLTAFGVGPGTGRGSEPDTA